MEPPLAVLTLTDVFVAFLFLMIGGLGTWAFLHQRRRLASTLLNEASGTELSEDKLGTVGKGARLTLATTLAGAVYSGVPALFDLSPFSIGWFDLGPALFGFGLGVLTVGAAMAVRLLFDFIRYQGGVTVRREVIGTLDEDKLKHAEVARRAAQERARILQKRNLGANFVIKQLGFSNAGIFKDVSWQLSPGINVMLGRNGYGKSYLLRLMVGLLSYDNERLAELVGDMGGGFHMRLNLLRDGNAVEIEHDGDAFDESTGKVPLLAIPDSRFINRAGTWVAADDRQREDDGENLADLARHGAHHFLHDRPYDTSIQTVLAQMCIEAIGKKGMDRGRGSIDYPESPQIGLIEAVMRTLTGEHFRFSRITNIGGARFAIELETEASPGQPIAIQKASQGTLSVIAIFGLLYQYLRQVYPETPEERLLEQKAIVLIDEIDAHLHPLWQRKIVHLLRQHFPNVQLILTAHSPLVVAGCSYGEVCVLTWVDGSLQVREFQQDFIGTPVDDIYREIFGIAERDETFLEYYAQLPLVRELEQELETLRSGPEVDQDRVVRTEKELSRIKDSHEKEEEELQLVALRRENEQLKRQLAAARGNDRRTDS